MPSVVLPFNKLSQPNSKINTHSAKSDFSTRKSNHFGIEVVSKLTWHDWETGKEFTKNIVLKNVKIKTQKLKYRVPSTRFFSTLYPKDIVLSAGTSFSLPVTFRPLEKISYEDQIEFFLNGDESKFTVQMQAVLPKLEIQVTDQLDFKMCAAFDEKKLSFTLNNISELSTSFHVKCTESFEVIPTDGFLVPFSTVTLNIIFKPKAAVIYEEDAIVQYGSNFEFNKLVHLKGIGKFPFLLINGNDKNENGEPEINFGKVPLGIEAHSFIELVNISQVDAPFTIGPIEKNRMFKSFFSLQQKSGIVPSQQVLKIPITYKPKLVQELCIDYFEVVLVGGVNKTVVKCHGSSQGPKVNLVPSIVNFNCVDRGEVSTKTIEVVNNSDVETSFKFMIDCSDSVFKFDHTSADLSPNSSMVIIISFLPTVAINFHRKIACIINGQQPCFLDLLGTCHTETEKPAILKNEHLKLFQIHQRRGLTFIPPEQLNNMRQENKLQFDKETSTLYSDENDLSAPKSQCADFSLMDEYFNDGYHSDIAHNAPHVSLDKHVCDFGQCQNLGNIEDQSLTITNHTKGTMTIVWTGNVENTFHASPLKVDIPALKSYSFTISFKPNASNNFYGCDLECYAHYKSLRDYRLVEYSTHFPPWCLTLTCTGNTFLPRNETFIPRYNLNTLQMMFPAVNINEAAYQTIVLKNTGSTPIMYDFQKENSGMYSFKPQKGLLTGPTQIFVVRFIPKENKIYQNKLLLRLNETDKHSVEIGVIGPAEKPSLTLENQGELYFPPTSLCSVTERKYSIHNSSLVPLNFKWKIKQENKEVLSVFPVEGVIHPNESQIQSWSFRPTSLGKKIMKPSVVVWQCGTRQSHKSQASHEFGLRAIGSGSAGQLEAEQSYIDVGTVVVGSGAYRHLVLYNSSDCNLHYRLNVDQNISGAEGQTMYDPIALELEHTYGVISARSRQFVLVSVKPQKRVYYQFAISYQLLTNKDGRNTPIDEEHHHLCHVLATGVYPTLSVTDARCYGSGSGIGKKQLWSLFNLDNLNMFLDSDPSAAELMYSVATRQSHHRRPPVYTRAILDFNFSAAPEGSDPCVVQLMLENSGAVPTQWSFLFPSDLQLELDYWAETGEFDEDELHEMKVMNNELFTVEPRHGVLDPGACQTVTCQYKHLMPGTDRLPLLLKLANGREILLNFLGVTVEKSKPYIHYSTYKYMFCPVAIAEVHKTKQSYELYNGGSVPVNFEVDTSALEIITQENYGHTIFECLTKKGVIPPGKYFSVDWVFSPLEARTYMVDIPIHISDGETALITFTGVGFEKKSSSGVVQISNEPDLSGVPSVQSVPIPGQLGFLSQERLAFGNIPLFSRSRRVVAMFNRSDKHRITFVWHAVSHEDQKVISIEPSEVTLEPGQGHLCKITFISQDRPSFYDINLVCEVVNNTTMNQYKKELSEWKKEKERQKVEFTITEKQPDADLNLRENSTLKLDSLERTPLSSPEMNIAKYKTLPPIKQRVEKPLPVIKHPTIKNEVWKMPEPPHPFLLHLGITARTHFAQDFQRDFPNEYNNFVIDKGLEKQESTCEKKNENNLTSSKINCLETEADIVSTSLTDILRALLDDTNFHSSVVNAIDEPIPYFQQYKNKLRTSLVPIDKSTPVEDESSLQIIHRDSLSSPIQKSLPASPDGIISPDLETRNLSVDMILETEQNQQSSTNEISERQFAKSQNLKVCSEFTSLTENLLENTLGNIMEEAFSNEFNLTARPRLTALLPRVSTSTTSANKHL